MIGWRNQRGFGFIEIVIVLAVVAVAGYLLLQYFGSTAKIVEKFQEERPLTHARFAADQATLGVIQGMVRAYQATNGQWPADKAAVVGLLASPPRFQCAGNDFEYDPASGALRLLIADANSCS
jgi:prepilin-type N-terminal cleavage/methylation domain-containing protein